MESDLLIRIGNLLAGHPELCSRLLDGGRRIYTEDELRALIDESRNEKGASTRSLIVSLQETGIVENDQELFRCSEAFLAMSLYAMRSSEPVHPESIHGEIEAFRKGCSVLRVKRDPKVIDEALEDMERAVAMVRDAIRRNQRFVEHESARIKADATLRFSTRYDALRRLFDKYLAPLVVLGGADGILSELRGEALDALTDIEAEGLDHNRERARNLKMAMGGIGHIAADAIQEAARSAKYGLDEIMQQSREVIRGAAVAVERLTANRFDFERAGLISLFAIRRSHAGPFFAGSEIDTAVRAMLPLGTIIQPTIFIVEDDEEQERARFVRDATREISEHRLAGAFKLWDYMAEKFRSRKVHECLGVASAIYRDIPDLQSVGRVKCAFADAELSAPEVIVPALN